MELNKYWGPEKDEYSDRDPDGLVGWERGYPHIKDCHDVLDIGCGIGNVVEWLEKRGHYSVGLTYQEQEYVRAVNLGRQVLVRDMHNLRFIEDNSFDAFIMWDSLEHSIAPLIALGEAKRVTRNGGKGLIFIPNQDWIECNYHIIVPTIRQMKHLFELARLTIADIVDMGNEQAIYKLQVEK